MKPRPTPAKVVATAATALILLSGCSGNDDDRSAAGATPASTPAAAFDPPKELVPVSAFGIERNLKDNKDTVSAGLVGQTAVNAGITGLTGRNIVTEGKPWTVPAAAAGITTSDLSDPMPVRLAGKEVVAIAYVQTGKDKGQVLFQWIDPADGTKLAEVAADLSTVFGPGGRGNRVLRQAYDATTGQIAIGVTPGSDAVEAKAGDFTVYADPKTRKFSVIPFVVPGGVLNGVVTGVRRTASGAVVLADGATGIITKQIRVGLEQVWPVGSGAKHAVFVGTENGDSPTRPYRSTLVSVDLVSGSIERFTSPTINQSGYTCFGDQAALIVCRGSQDLKLTEILGIDDRTGKKIWGYTAKQRVVPRVTAPFHGVVYAQTGAQPVLLDGATGKALPTATPTPSTVAPAGSALSLFDNQLQSPTAVTPYGGIYLQDATSAANYDFEKILIALKPTA